MKKNTALVSCFSLLSVAFLAGGCAGNSRNDGSHASAVGERHDDGGDSSLHRPDSVYPKIYDIQIGGSASFVDVTKTASPDMTAPAVSPGAVVAPGSPSMMPVTSSGAAASVSSDLALASQKLTAMPKKKLYFQVISPVLLKVSIYQRATSTAPRALINEIEGARIVSWVKPDYADLEFDFTPLNVKSTAAIKFVVSDRVLVKR